MIYNKLPIILLTQIASQPNDTTESQIAYYILSHLDSIQNDSISELATKCNVSNSSISRFCRKVGLNDFSELKEGLNSQSFKFEVASNSNDNVTRIIEHASKVQESINEVVQTIDTNVLKELAKDIHQYKQVTILGLLKASTAAINLQVDLLMFGKLVNVKLTYFDQLDFISHANQNDLVIIFSYTGAYFEEGLRFTKNLNNIPKIYLISGNRCEGNPFICKYIYFNSKLNQISHPYQLLFVSSLIAQEVKHYTKL
jgi:DNA-binding MurR/RpiR family transcriptional regulator